MDRKTIQKNMTLAGQSIRMTSDEQARLFSALEFHTDPSPSPTKKIPRKTRTPYSYFIFIASRVSVLAIIIFMVAGTGFVAASENALPGDFLYTFKVDVNEEIKSFIQPTTEARLAFAVSRTEERMNEAQELARQGRLDEEAQETLVQYIEDHGNDIQEESQELASKDPEKHQIVSEIAQQQFDEKQAELVSESDETPALQIVLASTQKVVDDLELTQEIVADVLLDQSPVEVTPADSSSESVSPSSENIHDVSTEEILSNEEKEIEHHVPRGYFTYVVDDLALYTPSALLQETPSEKESGSVEKSTENTLAVETTKVTDSETSLFTLDVSPEQQTSLDEHTESLTKENMIDRDREYSRLLEQINITLAILDIALEREDTAQADKISQKLIILVEEAYQRINTTQPTLDTYTLHLENILGIEKSSSEKIQTEENLVQEKEDSLNPRSEGLVPDAEIVSTPTPSTTSDVTR